MANDSNIQNQGLLIRPNFATWSMDHGDGLEHWFRPILRSRIGVFSCGAVGYLFFSSLSSVRSLNHFSYSYPTDNCFAQYGIGTYIDPQQEFPSYLNHTSRQLIVAPYLNSTNFAQFRRHLGFVWSCVAGFRLCYANGLLKFLSVVVPCGRSKRFYNPFTRTLLFYFLSFSYYIYSYPAPPTNQSTYRQWTIGPIYYSALVMAEAVGPSNATQIVDLLPNNGNMHTPAYSIYEGGTLVRILFFNYVTDPSGASDLIQLNLSGAGGSPGPTQVQVKCLEASSVSQKGDFTWTGQVNRLLFFFFIIILFSF